MVHDRVSPISQPQATFVGFEDLPCHLKGVVKLPGDGVGKECKVTGEGQYCHVKNRFKEKQANNIAPKSSLQLFKNICLLITSDLIIFQQYLR